MAGAAPEANESNEIADPNNLVRSFCDRNIVEDPRVLINLIFTEGNFKVPENFLERFNPHITTEMRHTCLSWIQELCDIEKCESSIFPLCANYFDRFLSKFEVTRSELQVCVSVCLVIATKLRQSILVTPSDIYLYCDRAYERKQILRWESLVLNGLNWDLSAVVATDYLDPILYRLPDFDRHREMVHRHATTLIHVTLLEIEIATMKPSISAIGAIGASIRGIPGIKSSWPKVTELIRIISDMTDINPAMLEQGVEIFERFVSAQARRLEIEKLRQAEEEGALENPYDEKSLW